MKKELASLTYTFKLKNIKRGGRVGNRSESTAEHNWSTMLLAKYFIKKYDLKLNLEKVYDIILYHDLVEIETGDTFIADTKKRKTQKDREAKAAEIVSQNIPKQLKNEYDKLTKDFEDLQSEEAKFVRAVDAIEPMIHWLDYPDDWKKEGFTEENLREWKQNRVEPFPELLDFFNRLIKFLKANNYI